MTLLPIEHQTNDSRFLIRNHGGHDMFQVLQGKTCQTGIIYPVEIFFSNDEEIKTFSEEGKLKEYVTSLPILKECLKEVLEKRKEMIFKKNLEPLVRKKNQKRVKYR